jgi:hypothetical protein
MTDSAETGASRKPARRRVLLLDEDDVRAARRVLAALRDEECSDKEASAPAISATSGPHGNPHPVRAVRDWLWFRQRRIDLFGPELAAESAFALLATLYAAEHREPLLTTTRVTELSWLAPSTALRWIDELADKGWIRRTGVAGDRRKVQLSLTPKARAAVEQLFDTSE